MKVLLINKFLHPKGGDATNTLNTAKLLSYKGHKVILWGMDHPQNPEYPYKRYFVSCVDYDSPRNIIERLRAGVNILYSFEARHKIEQLVKTEKPDIVHLNNFAHQISPSILDVFKRYRFPVVMTMHDYKLVCASYTMLSGDKPCQLCKNGRYFNCFLRRCVKNSRIKSLANTIEMYLHHNVLHIYKAIDTFIAPSAFMMDKVKEMGFKGRVVRLPYFIDTVNIEPNYNPGNSQIVYFGRLSREKGLLTLLKAMSNLPNIKLKIIGDGPLKESLYLEAKRLGLRNIDFVGYKIGEQLEKEIRSSMCAVVPSEWYENYPLSVLEAFALGVPVIGSNIGGIPELVKNGETGLLFEPDNIEDLRDKITQLSADPNKAAQMGRNARALVEKENNPEVHYAELMRIYQKAISQ